MARKPKHVSMDAAFKSVLRDMGLLTKRDITKLGKKIDRLEKMLNNITQKSDRSPKSRNQAEEGRKQSATASVLGAIKKSKSGLTLANIQSKTGFDEKKLRNIVFRLFKLGKIKRVARGKYEVA